jgi:hydrogenase-4 component F
LIELLLLVPLVATFLCYPLRRRRAVEIVSLSGSLVTMAAVAYLAYRVYTGGTIDEGLLYVDILSAYVLLLIAFVGLMANLYSVSYLGRELEEGAISEVKLRNFHLFFQMFIFTMVLVAVSDNLGIMWIAIEGTTLASAYLVGFYDRATSVEAAWKYLIICSVGITLALLGTVLLYASSVSFLGEASDALSWSTLMDPQVLANLDVNLLRIAFIFVLVGYGTKVGLAPMHTWLPDAHSQAPTPVSALLSAVLLNCAMYGILRFHLILSGSAVGPGFSSGLLLLFGMLSLATAAAFIVLSKDYKRMLAYSSIEHMGIIAVGFGIGGPLAIMGALFHMLNHALTKTLLFFGAGNVLQRYGTREIAGVKGLATVMPATAVLVAGGALAIVGCPPFATFLSEFMILAGAIDGGDLLAAAVYLGLLAVVFAAFLYHAGRTLFGNAGPEVEHGEVGRWRPVLMAVLLVAVMVLGLYMPEVLEEALERMASLFTGGSL